MPSGKMPGTHETLPLSCYVLHAAEYKTEIIDGKSYIIGTGKSDDRELCTFDTLASTTLLQSLLVLYESLDIHGGSMNLAEYEKKITPADIDKIIAWSVEHGLPFEERGEGSLWIKHGKVGFPLGTFYSRLNELYDCYLLWRVLYLHDTDPGNYYVANNVSLDECLENLKGFMSTLDVRYMPDFSVAPPSFMVVCPDIMEIAKTQMYVECTLNDSTYTVGICEVCGSVFVKKRKNNTQCPNCIATRVQRFRANQRAEKQRDEK